jgi:hypothetical protein
MNSGGCDSQSRTFLTDIPNRPFTPHFQMAGENLVYFKLLTSLPPFRGF